MRLTGKSIRARGLWALIPAFMTVLAAAVLLVGAGFAAADAGARATAKPGKPTAKTPRGAIATTKPTFTWGRAARATRYELRVYQGAKLLLKKTGIKKRSWTSAKALRKDVGLTWKVRAKNARGSGAWSKRVSFTIATPQPPPPSSAKAITAFTIAGQTGSTTINEAAHTIGLTVPFGTNVGALAPTIAITGASVSPASGVAQDFTAPRTYTVTAADASTQAYVVTVTVALSPAKAITEFEFSGFYPVVAGTINETEHTIAVTVPFGSSLEHVTVTFTTTGVSVAVGGVVQQTGFTTNDFTNPVIYTVTAADGTTQDYIVTVTTAADPSTKAITSFSFQGLSPAVDGSIDEGAHTIALTVPVVTNDTALVATFSTTGASVAVGGTAQVSGVTANDFTSPVTYTVTAADSSTRAYVVTVYRIGKSYQGGKIAYILQSGDPGYVTGQTHGLIAAAADQAAGIAWSNIATTEIGPAAQGTALGTGQTNTTAIVDQPGCTSGAAYVCEHLEIDDYDDWYLPSKDELNMLYLNRLAIGGFGSDWIDMYWSSSEYSATDAWYQAYAFTSNIQDHYAKSTYVVGGRVRAVRSF